MSAKLKLGMDAKRAYCNERGLGNYSRLLIEGLVRWSLDQLDLFLFTPRSTVPDYRQWLSESVHKVEPLGVQRLPGMCELWRGWLQRQDWVERRIELFHGLSHELPLDIGFSGSKVKTLVTVHDLIFIRHPELYPAWDRWTYLRKIKQACRMADSVIAISEQTKQDLLDLLQVPEEKITVLYQAVHPRYYLAESSVRSRPRGERPYFLYVGAFEDRKNLLRLIRAFSIVQKETGHGLLLIGKGALKKQMVQLINELRLQNQVEILSSVSSQELPGYYQGATALVYPSLFEGFGLPIAEALMSETLVITSQGSCFPESGGPGSLYIDPYSVEDIALAMRTVVSLSAGERDARLQMGRQHSQNFHWKITTQNHLNHYQKILKGERI